VVLFNLGGPEGPGDVRRFLRNLFSDPAIIAAPWPLRQLGAALLARLRERAAIANYAVMGGGSPLLRHTRDQAAALEAALGSLAPEAAVKVFVAMRYWSPTAVETAAEVAAFRPDQIVLAPLYPQFSSATSGSSMAAWRAAYRGDGASRAICCWYGNDGLIDAHAAQIRDTWETAGRPAVRLLFSAHGLPQSVIAGGDPYQWQIEATCRKIAARLGEGWDWRLCYQSRVGPLKWLGPSTRDEIAAAGADGVGVLIDPVAFVSEHIETLVELDRDYAVLAEAAGAPIYLRAPAVGTSPLFIGGLATAVGRALGRSGVGPDGEACAGRFGRCPYRRAQATGAQAT
jgi:protoporphyrin/coproporphyrin ferrochelatase